MVIGYLDFKLFVDYLKDKIVHAVTENDELLECLNFKNSHILIEKRNFVISMS